VDLGQDPHRHALLGGGKRCALPRESGSYDEYVVLRQSAGQSM
jgi:hypothetical protein